MTVPPDPAARIRAAGWVFAWEAGRLQGTQRGAWVATRGRWLRASRDVGQVAEMVAETERWLARQQRPPWTQLALWRSAS